MDPSALQSVGTREDGATVVAQQQGVSQAPKEAEIGKPVNQFAHIPMPRRSEEIKITPGEEKKSEEEDKEQANSVVSTPPPVLSTIPQQPSPQPQFASPTTGSSIEQTVRSAQSSIESSSPAAAALVAEQLAESKAVKEQTAKEQVSVAALTAELQQSHPEVAIPKQVEKFIEKTSDRPDEEQLRLQLPEVPHMTDPTEVLPKHVPSAESLVLSYDKTTEIMRNKKIDIKHPLKWLAVLVRRQWRRSNPELER